MKKKNKKGVHKRLYALNKKANSKTELPTPTDQIVAHLSLSWKTLLKMLILFLVFFLPSLKERSSQF